MQSKHFWKGIPSLETGKGNPPYFENCTRKSYKGLFLKTGKVIPLKFKIAQGNGPFHIFTYI